MRSHFLLSALVAVAAFLSGCTTVDDGFVMKQWNRNMKELGVYPKFPPEEDVRVGDIYLIPENDVLVNRVPGVADPVTYGLVIARLVDPTLITTHYKQRYSYEGTSTLPVNAATSLAYGTNTATYRAAAYPQEIRRVAFPNFFRVKATGAQVGALIPIGQIAAKLGIDARSVESATVTVEDAASTALPMAQLASLLVDTSGKLNLAKLGYASDNIARAFLAPRKADPNKGLIELFVINQVYYARAFDLSLGVSSDVKAGLMRGTPSASTPPASTASMTATAATGVQGATESVETALRSGVTSLIPATGFNLIASQSQAGTVGMTQVYDRYLAVGYRGLKVVVDPVSLRVIGVSAPQPGAGEAINNTVDPSAAEDAVNPKKKSGQ
jgi:hypothetical protein